MIAITHVARYTSVHNTITSIRIDCDTNDNKFCSHDMASNFFLFVLALSIRVHTMNCGMPPILRRLHNDCLYVHNTIIECIS